MYRQPFTRTVASEKLTEPLTSHAPEARGEDSSAR